MVVIVLMSLTACKPNPSATPKPNNEPLGFLGPQKPLNYGRQSAIYRHLSQIWQITHIDNTPVTTPVYLDLTQLSDNQGYVRFDKACAPILVTFNTHQIAKESLFVMEIERTLDECSDGFADKLMSIIADTRRLQRTMDDTLTLVSYQHTLTLTPATVD